MARVFEAIEPESFALCIANHLESIQYQHNPQQIAIDGKALRGSKSSQHHHIHAVSAWACESGITLSQTLVCHNLDWMQKDIRKKWKNLGCLIMVYRHTILEDGSLRSDTSYYMSSLTDLKAPDIAQYIRGHWAIENNCHWVIDTVFREDANQVTNRNSAKNLSTMRRIALNALKHAPEISRRKAPASMTKKQLRAAQNTDYREQCMSITPSV